MKITGQILKENREKRGISISEVALATKINNRVLIAMEEGDIENLPPKTFLRGFVQSYASYLGLDVEQILTTFYEEMGSTKPKTDIQHKSPNDGEEPPRREEGTPTPLPGIEPKTSFMIKFWVVAGIFVLIALIVYFNKKMQSYESETVIADYPKGVESLKPGAAATPTEASNTAAPTETTQPSPSPGESPAPAGPTPAASPEETATPTPSPSPAATTTPTPTPTPTATLTPSPSPSPSPRPAEGKTQEIIIEAFDTVDVDVQIDGESRRFKLKPEQVQTFKARGKVVLSFSDGGAVNVIVNGVERGVPGDLGKPKRLELP